MAKQPMSQASIALVDKIADITRMVTSSSEVMSGEVIAAGMSGAAIAQLQAQALRPIEDLQKGFWRHMEKVGEILEQFLRFFFTDKKFQYAEKDDTGKELIRGDEFNSSEFKDRRFDVYAEAVAGTVMSDVADINILDGLFSKGAISLKSYIECYPQNAIANRQKLIDSIERDKKDTVNQLTSQLEQATQLIQQQEQSVENAKTIINENRSLKEQLLQLQAEYTQKIATANQILVGLGAKAQEFHSDATEFAVEIARSSGMQQQLEGIHQMHTQPQVNPGGLPL
jgi:replicative superfamily II helicase